LSPSFHRACSPIRGRDSHFPIAPQRFGLRPSFVTTSWLTLVCRWLVTQRPVSRLRIAEVMFPVTNSRLVLPPNSTLSERVNPRLEVTRCDIERIENPVLIGRPFHRPSVDDIISKKPRRRNQRGICCLATTTERTDFANYTYIHWSPPAGIMLLVDRVIRCRFLARKKAHGGGTPGRMDPKALTQ